LQTLNRIVDSYFFSTQKFIFYFKFFLKLFKKQISHKNLLEKTHLKNKSSKTFFDWFFIYHSLFISGNSFFLLKSHPVKLNQIEDFASRCVRSCPIPRRTNNSPTGVINQRYCPELPIIYNPHITTTQSWCLSIQLSALLLITIPVLYIKRPTLASTPLWKP